MSKLRFRIRANSNVNIRHFRKSDKGKWLLLWRDNNFKPNRCDNLCECELSSNLNHRYIPGLGGYFDE